MTHCLADGRRLDLTLLFPCLWQEQLCLEVVDAVDEASKLFWTQFRRDAGLPLRVSGAQHWRLSL